MYPHERSLVERLKDKPFAIVGVNADDDKKRLKERMQKEKITWRSFWDGGPEGPISRKWNVMGFPTIYVLDAKGVIRARDVREEKELDKVIDDLLKEVKKN